ncbi:helicase [Rhodococcus rhodnii]|uniref:Helicase n=1 Tax=Rhodococcus rhodnii TaxID=38312 RepID=A0A6P2CKY0_9NOCA|nr:helicase [Rhodococcus rhodnii]
MDAERRYVDELYRRLDAERASVRGRYRDALRSDGRLLVERDAEVRALAKEIARLDVADNALCFGRLDAEDGARTYVGRLGLFDDGEDFTAGGDVEQLLLDWRAPAARPFYTATAAHPEGMRRRRRFLTRGRRVTEFTDDVLGRPHDGERGDAALLAAVNAPRGDGMRDIVATIQSEQDEVIRLDHPGVLVVEGGPGTGKTAVALHRVAYLLYTERARIAGHGVLVVGPTSSFIDHISRVLPSLGESDIVFATPATLLPGVRTTAEDTPAVAAAKGAAGMVTVLAAAVADRQRLPERPIPITLGGTTIPIDTRTAEWARDEARGSELPHNDARAVFHDIVSWVLAERALQRMGDEWLDESDGAEWDRLRASLVGELAENDTYAAALDELWPLLTPQGVLAELYTSPERLRTAGGEEALARTDGHAWTVSDVPLLDELTELLGETGADSPAAGGDDAEARYAEDVLDSLVSRQDSMDDEDHLYATDLLYAEDLAGRFEERDTRELAERAAAERDWTYRHVVVDEAQELSAMQWRVLMRRCPSRSFTVVGDLAQRRSAAGARSWSEMLDPYVPGRWAYRTLSVNYRTPAEIMAVAAGVLAEFAPEIAPPESVRASGEAPWARRVADDEVADAVAEFVRDESLREGTSIVIGPPDVPGAVPVARTKGLEFDAVLVVDPDRIVADGPRGAAELYVALTRATQRLGILYRGELPPTLARGMEVRSGGRVRGR